MSPRRSRIPLVAGLGLLASLVGYFAVTEAFGESVEAGEIRAPGPDVVPTVSRGSALEADGTPQPTADLTLRFDVRADLLPRQRGPIFRVFSGDDLLDVGVSAVAGPGSAGTMDLAGTHLLRFALPGEPNPDHRLVRLDANKTWEDHVLEGRCEVSGRVTGEGGKPLPDARVWIAGTEVTTDRDGRFKASSVHRGPSVPVAVVAKGHAAAYRIIDLGRLTTDRIEFALEAGAELEMRVLLPSGLDPEEARVFVRCQRSEGVHSSLARYPFFLQAVDGGHRPRPDGTLRIGSLPRDVGLSIVLRHPKIVTRTVRIEKRGEDPRLVVRGVRAKRFLSGVLLDEAGKPLAGARLVCPPTPRSHRFTMPPEANPAYAGIAHTDAQGQFQLQVPEGVDSPRVQVCRSGFMRLQFEARVGAGPHKLTQPLVMPAATDGLDNVLALRFGKASGERFRVRVFEGDREVSGRSLWLDSDVFEQKLNRSVLTDVRITLTKDGKTEERVFRNLAIRGRIEAMPLSPIGTRR